MLEKTKQLFRHINEESSKLEIESGIPISRYINSGQFLEKTGEEYLRQGNIIACYILINRLLTLFVQKIRYHEQYRSISQQQKLIIKKVIEKNIKFLEKVKIKLIEILDQAYINEEARTDELKHEKSIIPIHSVNSQQIKVEPIEFISEKEKIDGTIKVVQEQPTSHILEANRVDVQSEVVTDRDSAKIQTSSLPSYDRAFKPKPQLFNDSHNGFDTFSLGKNAIGRVVDNHDYNENKFIEYFHEMRVRHDDDSHLRSRPIIFNEISLSSFEDSVVKNENHLFKVDRNLKPKITHSSEELNTVSSIYKPHVDRSKKATIESYVDSVIDTMKLSSNVVIPCNLHECFVEIARTNTAVNCETCGILSGYKSGQQYVITHVIVPKQDGSENSCECRNEEEIMIYQDDHNLITLGWIHTHPSQSCFLSSVDLHTQYGYQCLFKEAIAAVVSIKQKKMEIYTLTSNGCSVLRSCSNRGFHMHNSDNLFEIASHIIDGSSEAIVVDLRN